MKDKFTDTNTLYDNSFIIKRDSKISELASMSNFHNIFMFSAVPGAGKSILARQVAETNYANSIWHDITDSDKDPLSFCWSLYNAIKKCFPNYSCAEMETPTGNHDKLKYETYIKAIMKSLKRYTRRKTVIVLDNTELLPTIGLGCKAVKTALLAASSTLHFIICSRRTCTDSTLANRLEKQIIIFDNSFFYFTKEEFHKLALAQLEHIIDLSGIDRIYAISEGWAHGIVTGLKYFRTRGKIPDSSIIAGQLDKFFEINALRPEDIKLYSSFAALSLLEEIPLEFSVKFSGGTELASFLINALDSNNFIQKKKKVTFILHNIYRSWLIATSKETFQKINAAAFLNAAASYELNKGSLTLAIKYLIRAQAYSRLESVMKDNIDEILRSDNNRGYNGILSDVPGKILRSTMWTALAYAYTSINIMPEQACRMFCITLQKFIDCNDKTGILLSYTGLVNFHFFLRGTSINGLKYKQLIQDCLTAEEENLSPVKIVSIYTSLAFGGMNYYPQKIIKEFINKVLPLVEKERMFRQKIEIYYVYALFNELMGSMQLCERFTDLLFAELHTIKKDPFSLLTFIMKLHRFYNIQGETKISEYIGQYAQRTMSVHMELSMLYKALLDIYETDNFAHSGDIEKLQRHMEKYSMHELNNLPAHIRAAMTSHIALGLATKFDETSRILAEKALKVAIDAEMNEYTVSEFYFYAGAIYTLLGNFKEAEMRLTKALELAQEFSNERINASSCAYMSYLYDTISDRRNAAEYAVSAVRFMMKTRQKKLKWSMPDICQNMLKYAHENDNSAEYADNIAFQQFNISFTGSSEMIPVMQINAFGEIEIRIGETALSPEQLSGNFRTMIAIILSSKNYTAHQEVIQSYIWPSSGKEHARKSFDNLMSRFRKLLSNNFPGINPKDYITINNGIVRMSHVKCNADDFINKVGEARISFENKEFTKCLLCLLTIKDTYSERYFSFINDIEKVDAKRQYTDAAMIDMMTLIYKMNSYLPDIIPLEPYLDQWHDIFIHETEMVRLAYLYYKDKNDKVKCFTIIKNFEIFLREEGFSEDEVNELIYAVKS
ncbi:ATP-dependent transcriptional regulator protein-like protein [Denitrovibrio acetiphilus DSM 12809]|uniref:ATP-dependent transcriptional regulator protein-like protein n=1 Tax=Denitrovibrio acetiphilus (strain DSM 12809 / NBRC 114555 / N2460) TaxID=522772 RepID=D4H1N7_DENA2|nr:hypothetical protein [Denitrovibrio acetiphilus]ADD68797.1 ATP-dependent transcriptional regulator protein-like protein [Denitrovibrio acetiphilus DSM 12809]